MMIHQRPQHEEEEGYLILSETTLLAEQGMVQFRADALLNELAELVRRSNLPWGNKFRLFHDIGTLRGYIRRESRRVLVETRWRCN
jgi:hypothetical protein